MESCFSCFYLAYCICESFAIWIGIFQKSYKKTKTTTNRRHTERGHLCVNYHYRYSYKFINGISAFSLGWIYTWRAFGLPTGRPYLTIFWNAGIAFNLFETFFRSNSQNSDSSEELLDNSYTEYGRYTTNLYLHSNSSFRHHTSWVPLSGAASWVNWCVCVSFLLRWNWRFFWWGATEEFCSRKGKEGIL